MLTPEEFEALIESFGEAAADPFAHSGPEGEPPTPEARQEFQRTKKALLDRIMLLFIERDSARANHTQVLKERDDAWKTIARRKSK